MIYILLPAFNEELSLPRIFPKIDRIMKSHNFAYKVIVGNDGSRDKTAELLERYQGQYPVDIVTHKINRGLGETSRDLFERAAELGSVGDYIVRIDADDTHEPHFIPVMIKRLDEGYDVVIASRFQPGGGQKGVNAYRAFVSRAANIFMKFFFPIKNVREYSCGFRAYRMSIIKKAINFYGNNFIQLKGLGFTGTLEKLVKLKMMKARFSEVAFILRYDQKVSDSKMVSNVTTLGYIVMTLLYYWPWGGWRTNYPKKLRYFVEIEKKQRKKAAA